jgi:MFS family permease
VPSDGDDRWAGVRGALRHRNYQLFFAGQLVSLIGTWTQSVAQTWLVYRLTGSPLWLGILTFCQQAPVFFLATLGGSIADRYPRRRILVATQTAAMALAFALATVTLTGTVGVTQLLVLAGLLGVVNAVDIPTRQSFVLEMVGRDHLMNALALNSSMVNGARILGPAIAGFAIKAFGEGWCFFVNGVSFIAVISGLLAMRDLPPPPTRVAGESAFRRVLDGFRFVVRDERVRTLLALFAVTAMAGMPYSTLMPIFASRVFHGDASTLGWLMGAAGVGALLGALALASRRGIRGAFGWIGLACGAFGVALVLFAWSRTLWLSIAILVPLGAANMILMSATNTLLQTMTPDALRGRVIAIWAMIVMGFAPFGSLLAGSLATAFGPSRTLVIGGAVCMCAAATFAWWLRSARPTTYA